MPFKNSIATLPQYMYFDAVNPDNSEKAKCAVDKMIDEKLISMRSRPKEENSATTFEEDYANQIRKDIREIERDLVLIRCKPQDGFYGCKGPFRPVEYGWPKWEKFHKSSVENLLVYAALADHNHHTTTPSTRYVERCIEEKLMNPDSSSVGAKWVFAGILVAACPPGILPKGSYPKNAACAWYVMHYYTRGSEMYDHIVWVASYMFRGGRALVFRKSVPLSPWPTCNSTTEPISVEW